LGIELSKRIGKLKETSETDNDGNEDGDGDSDSDSEKSE